VRQTNGWTNGAALAVAVAAGVLAAAAVGVAVFFSGLITGLANFAARPAELPPWFAPFPYLIWLAYIFVPLSAALLVYHAIRETPWSLLGHLVVLAGATGLGTVVGMLITAGGTERVWATGMAAGSIIGFTVCLIALPTLHGVARPQDE
jgi:hypothetical protein